MQFEHLTYLYLLAVIPILLGIYFITSAWRKNAIKKFGDPLLMQSLMERFSTRRKFTKFLVLLLALASFIIALANLRMGSKREKVEGESSEVVICFDVSNSMLAEDVKPDRLTRAKILAAQIIEELAGNKMGLIVFAGKAYVQVPLTVDARTSLLYLNTVNTGMVQTQGTAIGDAIAVAMEVFDSGGEENKKRGNRAIIIITDGESHEESTLEMVQKAADENIKIITIGLGTVMGAPIPIKRGGTIDYKKDKEGNIVLTKLNEQALIKIAEAGNGAYKNLSEGRNVISMVKEQVNSLEKESSGEYEFTEYQNHFQIFLFVGIFLFTIEFFMSDKKPLWLDKINVFGAQNKSNDKT